ncbi:hypothetical protein L615_011600000030 [Nocardioides sp. J9]|uniref:DUF6461 domain-containing protein n=1 Tax=Nocardioides sp. J9 TaxID=935844 RepID=UPI0011ACA6FA|nr:DUF6461 domain-containing protein [Nocardioides sp. J9]TWH03416.1 hypothetical protein L615_011600000030 [Nocardioides sp. J9]
MPVMPDSFSWVRSTLGEAACLTLAPDATTDEVATAFGCDQLDEDAATFADADGHDRQDGGEAWLTQDEGNVLTIEVNGFEGTRPEVLRQVSKASAKGLAASIFWNVNEMVIFTAARKGKVVCSVELLDVDPEDVPRSLRRLAALTADETVDAVAVGAAMASVFTGVGIEPAAISQASRRTLVPVPDAFDSPPLDDWRLLNEGAPHVVTAVGTRDEQWCRDLALWAARAAATEAGVVNESPVQDLFIQLGNGEISTLPAALLPVISRWEREQQAWEKEHPHWDGDDPWSTALEGDFIRQRSLVGRTLRLTAHPDARQAAIQVVDHAELVFRRTHHERPLEFVEDQRGRRWGQQPEWAHLRARQFLEAATTAAFTPSPDWNALTEQLPAPLSSEERAEIIRLDGLRQAQGDFDTYQWG